MNDRPAPTQEAKMTAVQIRQTLFRMLEAAIDNRWKDVLEGGYDIDALANHALSIEARYQREGREEETE